MQTPMGSDSVMVSDLHPDIISLQSMFAIAESLKYTTEERLYLIDRSGTGLIFYILTEDLKHHMHQQERRKSVTHLPSFKVYTQRQLIHIEHFSTCPFECDTPTNTDPQQYSNKIFITGGRDQRTGEVLDMLVLYDPVKLTWSIRSPMIKSRCGHTMALWKNTKLLVTGGEDDRKRARNHCEVYDLLTDQWSTISILPLPRTHHSCCVHNDTLYISGGENNSKQHRNLWNYDEKALSWTALDEDCPVSLPFTRSYHSMFSLNTSIVISEGSRSSDKTAVMKFKPDITYLEYRGKSSTPPRHNLYDETSVKYDRVSPWSLNMSDHSQSGSSVFNIGNAMYFIPRRQSNTIESNSILFLDVYNVNNDSWTTISAKLEFLERATMKKGKKRISVRETVLTNMDKLRLQPCRVAVTLVDKTSTLIPRDWPLW